MAVKDPRTGQPFRMPGPAGLSITGPQGPSGTLSVGSVTTLDAAQPASVANAGTSSAAVLNFSIPRGPQGVAGPSGGVRFTFDPTTTDADPANGAMRFNSATISSVTQIFIDNLEAVVGADVSAWIDLFDDSTTAAFRGLIYVADVNDATKFALFKINSAVVNGSGYRKIPVLYLAGPGGFAQPSTLSVLFSPTGNAGAGSGDVIGPSSATDGRLAAADGATGKLIKFLTPVQARAAAGATGNVLRESIVPAGSFAFLPEAKTFSLEMCGAGAAGGGAGNASGTSSTASVGSGGGAGGEIFGLLALPETGTATIALGAGGVGVVGADGGNGGNTTYTDAIRTLTAPGGFGGKYGGIGATISPPQGGLGGVPASGGTRRSAGAPGAKGLSIGTQSSGSANVLVAIGGDGGASSFGAPGQGVNASTGSGTGVATAGGAALGPGAGGGGAGVISSTATRAGGNGGDGFVRIVEYG